MRIFKGRGKHLEVLPDTEFEDEDELHRIVEDHLSLFFPDLEMVQHKPNVGGKQPDTLAYDPNLRTFVIIEFKKKRRMEMALQVAMYKELVKEHKNDCVVPMLEKNPRFDKRTVNWSKIRTIFVKPGFTRKEIEAYGQRDLVDLCEVHKFQDKLIVNQFGKDPGYRSSLAVDTRLGRPNSRTRWHSKSDRLDSKHSGNPLPETRDLYRELEKKICDKFPNIKPRKTKAYFGFYLDNKLVCRVKPSRHYLTLHYNTNSADSLPEDDFVTSVSDTGRGLHRSKLLQTSHISRALVYVGMLYQSAGYSPRLDTTDPNVRPRKADNQNISQMAHKVIIDKLRDGKEHTLPELYSRMFEALDGMSVPEKKARYTIRRKLHSLKNAGKITNVGRGAYKRA